MRVGGRNAVARTSKLIGCKLVQASSCATVTIRGELGRKQGKPSHFSTP